MFGCAAPRAGGRRGKKCDALAVVPSLVPSCRNNPMGRVTATSRPPERRQPPAEPPAATGRAPAPRGNAEHISCFSKTGGRHADPGKGPRARPRARPSHPNDGQPARRPRAPARGGLRLRAAFPLQPRGHRRARLAHQGLGLLPRQRRRLRPRAHVLRPRLPGPCLGECHGLRRADVQDHERGCALHLRLLPPAPALLPRRHQLVEPPLPR